MGQSMALGVWVTRERGGGVNGRGQYPQNWDELRAQVLERAADCCEGCGVAAGASWPKSGKPVVLAIAHMFENDLATQDIGRLRALCATCHERYDREMHGRHRAEARQHGGSANAFRAKGAHQYPLHVGFWVAIVTLRPQTCHVGQVEAVDDVAIRMTLVDWLLGSASGHDFVVPWSNVAFICVATPNDDLDLWAEQAKRWQARYWTDGRSTERDEEGQGDG